MNKIFILRNDNTLERVKAGLYHELKAANYDKPIQVTLSLYKEDKTGEQRGLFHTLCKLLGDELGYTLHEIKELVKAEMLPSKMVTVAGITKEITESSEKLKRDGYSELIEATYRLAAEAGVVLPLPNRYAK